MYRKTYVPYGNKCLSPRTTHWNKTQRTDRVLAVADGPGERKGERGEAERRDGT